MIHLRYYLLLHVVDYIPRSSYIRYPFRRYRPLTLPTYIAIYLCCRSVVLRLIGRYCCYDSDLHWVFLIVRCIGSTVMPLFDPVPYIVGVTGDHIVQPVVVIVVR